jgi:hypothetical protein
MVAGEVLSSIEAILFIVCEVPIEVVGLLEMLVNFVFLCKVDDDPILQ